MSDILITIGITCFNAEDTIERAISGALSQSWKNIEILVVDDASTDSSRKKVQRFNKKDDRVKLLKRNVNGGPAAARNTILKASQGKYIVFFDDDDESLPDRLMVQYARLSKYEKNYPQVPVCCYASGKRRYPNGYQLPMPAIGSQPKVPVGHAIVDYLLFNGRHDDVFYGAGIPTCALMLRRSVLDQFKGFDENLRRVEDADLAIRIGLSGGHFIGCEEELFIQYATIASDKTPQKNLDSELMIVEKFSSYLTKKNIFLYAKYWKLLRYYHFRKNHFKFLLVLLKIFMLYPKRTTTHLLSSAPKRWRHERNMEK
jgi:glycosyltransferase involved in cell wall biosynthesis